MDLQIPLNKLKFGHEDGEGINARVTGRDDGIPELAANIFANRSDSNPSGLIENLIVKPIDGEYFSIANGNRRKKALLMIDGSESAMPIPCTLHEVDSDKAFEYSLTTAITAQQLHPVDQYEAFARLEEHGKTNEEIAGQYGLTEKEVLQALALGRLSPKIRQAWRAGDIKAEVAQAFTLALDHNTQDKLFGSLEKAHALTAHNVKRELGAYETDEDVTQLLDVVGDEAYVNAGGHVTRDLFGHSHIVSNAGLLQQMARHVMIAHCERLSDAGWGWVEILANLPQAARHWPVSEVKTKVYEGDEEQRLKACRARLAEIEQMDDDFDDALDEENARIAAEIDAIENAVRLRSYPDKKRKTLGCIVTIEDGRIVVLAGIKRPAEAAPPIADADDGDETQANPAPKKTASAASSDPEPDISNALLHRLSLQLTNAAATALIQDERLALCVLLAGFDCFSNSGVRVSVSGLGMRGSSGKLLGGNGDMLRSLALAIQLKPAERIALLAQVAAGALDFQNASLDNKDQHGAGAICSALDPKALNAALRGAFDAKDYFNGVSKALCLKAIEEALGPDLARQQAKNTKPEIAAFAIENVPPAGWLPLQLRAKGYDGPPVKKSAKPAAEPAKPAKPSTTAAKVKQAKAGREATRQQRVMKRAAASKKTAKKTAKRKR